MKNSELQKILRKYPKEMDVKLYIHEPIIKGENIVPFINEHIADHAENDRMDDSTGFVIKGTGERYIIINPPIN